MGQQPPAPDGCGSCREPVQTLAASLIWSGSSRNEKKKYGRKCNEMRIEQCPEIFRVLGEVVGEYLYEPCNCTERKDRQAGQDTGLRVHGAYDLLTVVIAFLEVRIRVTPRFVFRAFPRRSICVF